MFRTEAAQLCFAATLACPLAACGPVVDPPPLVIQECSADDSPTELARFDYDPDADFEPFDLGEAVTVHFKLNDGTSKHSIVDNCGGTPLRLKRTFNYRPGAARVGGDIVLCNGGGDDGFRGVWELLEDGSAGRDLGLGLGCPDRLSTRGSPTGVSAFGFVWTESGLTQHAPDGTVRSIPFAGDIIRVNDAWLVRSRDGEVAWLGPEGADPVVLDIPEIIADVLPSSGSSSWVAMLPVSQEPDARRVYALDTNDGSWFSATWNSDPFASSLHDGLVVVADRTFPSHVMFARAPWDVVLLTNLDPGANYTVVDAEHVLFAKDQDVRPLRIPLAFPGENEAPYEVEWEYPVPGEGRVDSLPGVVWNGVVLLPMDGETWVFPLDGSEPTAFLPFLPRNVYFGTEFITALGWDTVARDDAKLIRRALGGELEVIAEGVLDFQDRAWTPQLGRILYAVRDGDDVSIRQHRLTD